MSKKFETTTPTADKFLRLNKRDLSIGLKSLMAKGEHNLGWTQSFLSSASGISEAQISEMLNTDNDYTPTLRTLTRLLVCFDMTILDFYLYVNEITYKP